MGSISACPRLICATSIVQSGQARSVPACLTCAHSLGQRPLLRMRQSLNSRLCGILAFAHPSRLLAPHSIAPNARRTESSFTPGLNGDGQMRTVYSSASGSVQDRCPPFGTDSRNSPLSTFYGYSSAFSLVTCPPARIMTNAGRPVTSITSCFTLDGCLARPIWRGTRSR